MTKIYFVRHGFSPANNAGYNQQKNIRELCAYDEFMPLDEYGVRQAEEVGRYLAGEIGGEKVLFLVSPYYRTRQTTHKILESIPHDEQSGFELMFVDALREINQGLEYAEPKVSSEDLESLTDVQAEMLFNREMREEYSKKGHDPESLPYLYGESMQDVSHRLRKLSADVKGVVESNEYDSVVVVSHNSVIKALYKLVTGESLAQKSYTGSVNKIYGTEPMPSDEAGKDSQCFVPEIVVPKGYKIDFGEFKNYSRVLEFKKLLDEHKSNPEFNKFWGERKTDMPLEDECAFIEKDGESLVILPGGSDKQGYLYIDAPIGQDKITHDKKSTSTYYVLSGEGKFFTKALKSGEFEERRVKAGDTMVVEPNTVFYYESLGGKAHPLRLIERMEPNFSEENVVVHGAAPNFLGKQKEV